jgi:hypothetical protein
MTGLLFTMSLGKKKEFLLRNSLLYLLLFAAFSTIAFLAHNNHLLLFVILFYGNPAADFNNNPSGLSTMLRGSRGKFFTTTFS